MEQSPILVIGHKNPDTDSICSAIAYANLKNQIDSKCYIPKRAGNINSETSFVLDYFKIPVPDLVEDVNTQVMDIEYRKTPGVKDNISLKAAWKMMRELDVVTLPVVERNNVLTGIITINDIAKSYMDDFENDMRVQNLVSKTEWRLFNIAVAINNDDPNMIYSKEDLAKAADWLLKYKATDASFSLGYVDPEVVYVSARSRGVVNVGEIMSQMGGGGNEYGAATRIENADINEVRMTLEKVIRPGYKLK